MLLPMTAGLLVGLFGWAFLASVVSGATPGAPIVSGMSSAGSPMPGFHGFHTTSVPSQGQESFWGSLLGHVGVPHLLGLG